MDMGFDYAAMGLTEEQAARLKKEMDDGSYGKLSREQLILALLMGKAHDDEIKPKKVSIAPEELERIRELLCVFHSYIEGHYYFDFVLSSKFGVIRPDIEGNYSYYSDADSLFDALVNEIYSDVRDLKLDGDHMRTTIKGPNEEAELRKRVMTFIDALCDREHYSQLLQEFIEYYTDDADSK